MPKLSRALTVSEELLPRGLTCRPSHSDIEEEVSHFQDRTRPYRILESVATAKSRLSFHGSTGKATNNDVVDSAESKIPRLYKLPRAMVMSFAIPPTESAHEKKAMSTFTFPTFKVKGLLSISRRQLSDIHSFVRFPCPLIPERQRCRYSPAS